MGPRRGAGTCPLSVQFLSFLCGFQQTNSQIIGFCLEIKGWHLSVWEILDPPLSGLKHVLVSSIKITCLCFFVFFKFLLDLLEGSNYSNPVYHVGKHRPFISQTSTVWACYGIFVTGF